MRSCYEHCGYLAVWLALGALPAAAQQGEAPRATPWPGYSRQGPVTLDEPQSLPAIPALQARPLDVDSTTANPQSGGNPSPFPVRLAQAETPDLELVERQGAGTSLKLSPRKERSSPSLTRPAAATPAGAVGTVAASLGIVLGLFLVIVWLSKRFAPAGTTLLPKEAVELLGRTSLGTRQQLQLIRVGNKLLLLAVTPAGCEPLTEVTDPAEVEHLLALCQRGRPGSSSAAFSQVLGQLAREPVRGGFAGPTSSNVRGRA